MASLLNMSGGSLLNKGLPYDAEIEYLESTGTQYIDTLYYPNMNTKVTCTYSYRNTNGKGFIYGTAADNRNVYRQFLCQIFEGILWPRSGSAQGDTLGRINIDSNQIYDITQDCIANFTCGSVIKSYRNDGMNTDLSLYLFRSHHSVLSQNIDTIIHRIYAFSIIENNVTLFDFIPVRKDGVGYLYDKVSNQLFGNSGTGDFILGPDKTN